MGRRIVLHENEVFGRLTVINGGIVDPSNGQSLSKCKCECGKEVIKSSSEIRRGKIRSCGCLKIETHEKAFNKANSIKKINISVGKYFGEWKVIGLLGTEKRGSLDVKCLCSCGTVKTIRGTRLINKLTRSCGCKRGEHISLASKK